jgi:hypothetical protein
VLALVDGQIAEQLEGAGIIESELLRAISGSEDRQRGALTPA